jgi:hypothetical protein
MQTNPQSPILLAVNPGTRYLGVALFRRTCLIEWRVKVVKAGGPDEKSAHVATILSTLIEQYQPNILVLKKPHPRRSSVLLDRLTLDITRLGARHELRVYSFTTASVAHLLSPERPASMRALAQHIATEYPMLKQELDAERVARHAYHMRMFEAVGLGMAARRYLGRI